MSYWEGYYRTPMTSRYWQAPSNRHDRDSFLRRWVSDPRVRGRTASSVKLYAGAAGVILRASQAEIDELVRATEEADAHLDA